LVNLYSRYNYAKAHTIRTEEKQEEGGQQDVEKGGYERRITNETKTKESGN